MSNREVAKTSHRRHKSGAGGGGGGPKEKKQENEPYSIVNSDKIIQNQTEKQRIRIRKAKIRSHDD